MGRRRGPGARVDQVVRRGCGQPGPEDPRVFETELLEGRIRVSYLTNRS